MFSSVNGPNNEPGEIIAIWPSKTAALPTQVVGAAVK
jgi:hypothetical protein